MELTRARKSRNNYRGVRNKLIVWLMKVKGWSAGEVQKDALERNYGHKISRVRVGQIFEAYKKMYPRHIYKNYTAPDTL